MASGQETTEGFEGIPPARLNTLVDGIFAVVMTLLVFDLKVPEIAATQVQAELLPRLMELIPNLGTYFISFAVLGIFWVGHHNFFFYVKRVDRVMLWINILFLAIVALVPFSTGLLAKYGTNALVSALYGINFVVIGLILYGGWHYATHHHRLVDPRLREEFIQHVKGLVVLSPIIYGIATLASFFHPLISWAIYVGLPLYYIFQTHTDKVMVQQWQEK